MKIYLTATSTLAKYSMLYENLYQIFSKENAFEIIDVCCEADCVVSVGDITNEIIECKQKYKKAVVRFLFRSDISQYFYTDVTLVDHTFCFATLISTSFVRINRRQKKWQCLLTSLYQKMAGVMWLTSLISM